MSNLVFTELLLHPYPFRTSIRWLIKKLSLGNYLSRLNINSINRANYAYCVYNAASLAKKLGYSGISVIELGVAGGKGLLALEECSAQIQKLLSIDIEIYGFDIGEGLPEPLDYRDLPYHWKKEFYKMDVKKLTNQLQNAKLILGDVKDTVNSFFDKYSPKPIGAVMFDLDYYSSTFHALKLFDAEEKYLLPRIFCYFDDIEGGEVEMYNDYTGVRLAMNEFNKNHDAKKIAKIYYRSEKLIAENWYRRIRIFHNFKHSNYNDFVGEANQQLSI